MRVVLPGSHGRLECLQRREGEALGGELLREIEITHVLDCIADPAKIRVVAELSDDVSEIMPYLNQEKVADHKGLEPDPGPARAGNSQRSRKSAS